MQLFSYLKGLFHRITRGQIQASCDAVIESIQKHTMPAYVQASETFKRDRISSERGKSIVDEYSKKVYRPKGGESVVDHVLKMLQNTVTLLTQISEKSDTVFSDVESTLGMSYQKAMYLRLISAATFANDYARALLNYLYVVETEKLDPSASLADALTPAQLAWVEGNFSNFCVVASILSNETDKVIEQINELPDAVVDEHSEQTLAAVNGKKMVDPLGFSALDIPITIDVKWNPFYLIAQLRADYRVAQYRCAKEEVELLQLRLLNYQKLMQRKPDAGLQRQIDNLTQRVTDLQMQLHEMEKRYG